MPFLPTDLSNLWAWYKADAGVTGSTYTVSAWADQSGNGRNLTLANPLNLLGLYEGPDFNAIKSQSNPDGYGAFLSSVNVPALTTATIYMVARQFSGEGSVRGFMSSDQNFSIYRHDFILSNAVVVEQAPGTQNAGIAITNGEFYSMRLRISADETLRGAVNNGTEVASSWAGQTPIANPLSMFGTGDKEIAEVLIYTTDHNSAQRLLVEDYLSVKYFNTPLITTTMALTKIPGNLVGTWISFDLVTPEWQEIVCAEESADLSGSASTNVRKTKTCGPLKSVSFEGWTMSGAGVANATPTAGEVSADDLVVATQDTTPVLVKMAHSTDDSLYYRQGTGYFSAYDETAPEDNAVGFSYTIEIDGNLVIVAPA